MKEEWNLKAKELWGMQLYELLKNVPLCDILEFAKKYQKENKE